MAIVKKEPVKKDTYRKVEDSVFRFTEEGDLLEGMLVDKEPGHQYNNMVYRILTDSGETMTVFGTTILDQKMRSVKVNDLIRIVYSGTQTNKKKGMNDIKMFDVFIKTPEN